MIAVLGALLVVNLGTGWWSAWRSASILAEVERTTYPLSSTWYRWVVGEPEGALEVCGDPPPAWGMWPLHIRTQHQEYQDCLWDYEEYYHDEEGSVFLPLLLVVLVPVLLLVSLLTLLPLLKSCCSWGPGKQKALESQMDQEEGTEPSAPSPQASSPQTPSQTPST